MQTSFYLALAFIPSYIVSVCPNFNCLEITHTQADKRRDKCTQSDMLTETRRMYCLTCLQVTGQMYAEAYNWQYKCTQCDLSTRDRSNVPNFICWQDRSNVPNLTCWQDRSNVPNLTCWQDRSNVPNLTCWHDQTHAPSMTCHPETWQMYPVWYANKKP